MNQYPVLFISFKDVDGLDFEKAYAKLCAVVADLCKKLEKLPSCEGVNGADAEIFERLMYQRASSADVQNALNEYLKFTVITGCLRIAKESIFTGTNNYASYSVLDDRFGRYFGFTQAEVDALSAAAGLSNKAVIFREWYDGYVMGNTSVYCPWDAASYVSELLYDPDAEPLFTAPGEVR